MTELALIVGAGPGLSASLARLFAAEGMAVALAARNVDKLYDLVRESGAKAYGVDAAEPDAVRVLFERVEADFGANPDLVVYNAGARLRGSIDALEPAEVLDAYRVGGFGAFLTAREAARRMLWRGSGSIFFTGATASVKGMAQSAPFAMAKFAQRGLAQSLARELGPKGIHVAHFVIDGQIGDSPADAPDSRLHPDAIARTYLAVHRQPRSAWTHEVELRPWTERF